jgi:hypothetical protein
MKVEKSVYLNISIVFLIYLLLSILITYPLVFNLEDGLWVGYGDIFGVVWGNWAIKNHLSDQSFYTDFIAYPFGVHIISSVRQPVLEVIIKTLSFLFNEIASYNIIVLLSFPLTAFCTYLLFRFLEYGKIASLIGGFIFGFTPSAFLQSTGGHITYFLNFPIPLFLMAMFYNKNKRTLFSSLMAGIAYVFVVFSTLYFGYFCIFLLILFILFDFKTSTTPFWEFLKNYGVIILISFILIVAVEYDAIFEQFALPSKQLVEIGRRRSIESLYVYSSRLYEFFIPQITHPVFGDYFQDFIRTRHLTANLFEQTIYLGITPLIILVLTFYLLEKNLLNKKYKSLFFFFLSGFVLMVLLSFPPSITILGLKIPLISSFLYRVAPMFRVYTRTVILAVFFLSGIVVIFLNRISEIIKKKTYLIISIVVFLLIAFEYWEYSGDLILDTTDVPPVYQWLSEDRDSKVIAEYPMMRSDEASFYTYIFYQRIHRKRLVNGAAPGTEGWEFFTRINDISNPQTVKLLKEIGTDYVIIHFDKYKEGVVPYPLKRFYSIDLSSMTYNNYNDNSKDYSPSIPYGLELYKNFGSVRVYVIK